MLKIPRRFSHYLFAIIQSGMTTGIATGIASLPFHESIDFLSHWLRIWAVSWTLMVPVVILAAPLIRAMVMWLTMDRN